MVQAGARVDTQALKLKRVSPWSGTDSASCYARIPRQGDMSLAMAKKRILVIDDQEPFLDVMSSMLTRLRYDAVSVSDCFHALYLLSKETFDLVIVDMMMPQVGGLLFIKLMRQEQPKTPILAVSGYCDKLANILEMTEVDAILPKPIRLDRLRMTLNDIFLKKKTGTQPTRGRSVVHLCLPLADKSPIL